MTHHDKWSCRAWTGTAQCGACPTFGPLERICEEHLHVPVRIYALAKELKLDSKELVDLCTRIGIPNKGSALASLEDDEVSRIRKYLAGGSGPDRDQDRAVRAHRDIWRRFDWRTNSRNICIAADQSANPRERAGGPARQDTCCRAYSCCPSACASCATSSHSRTTTCRARPDRGTCGSTCCACASRCTSFRD